MPDPDYYAQTNSGLLPSPFTKQRAIERAHLWWSIYLVDIQVSLTLSIQGNIYLDPLEVQHSVNARLPGRLLIISNAAKCCHHKSSDAVRYLA